MARRTVKIGKVTSIEQARAVLIELLPPGATLLVDADFRDSQDPYGLSSTTRYSALVYRGNYSEHLKVEAHKPDLLVRRFVEDVLPLLQARQVPTADPPPRRGISSQRRLIEVDPTV